MLLFGCSLFEEQLPGEYVGTLQREDGAVVRSPSGDGDTTKVTRTSGTTSSDGERVEIIRVGEAGGRPLYEVRFGADCRAAFTVDSPRLIPQTETTHACSCPVGGDQTAAGVPSLSGSFDGSAGVLELKADVMLGGPEYGGGCAYSFRAKKADRPK